MDEKNILITISGPPASGTSTIAGQLSDKLNFEHISGGDIFRTMAEERDTSLAELTEEAEHNASIDKQLDSRLKNVIDEYTNGDYEVDGNGLIVESRLSGWHARDDATVSVYLNAPPEIRVNRITGREETVRELEEREDSEAQRYKNYYNIDINDLEIYDLVIDTYENSPQYVVKQIENKLNEKIS